MTTELTQVQIEEIIKSGNEAKANNKGKIPYGFNAELAEKYGRTPQSISQIISGTRRSKKSKKKEIIPVIKKEKKIETAEVDTSKVPEEKKDEFKEKIGNPGFRSFIQKPKYRLPNFADLRMFLQDHESDPVCKKLYYRMFVNNRDAGTYRDFYYIIEEMNKK